jgi:hypothetical protein
MNNRIREAAEQVVGPSRLHGGEFALMGNEQVERFALLIIDICRNIAEDGFHEEIDGQEINDKIARYFKG